jgi:hypothetical protein
MSVRMRTDVSPTPDRLAAVLATGLRVGASTRPPRQPCCATGVVVRFTYDPTARTPEELARRALFSDAKEAAPADSELGRGAFDNKQDVVTPAVEPDGTIVDAVQLTPWEDGDEIFVSSACGHGILKSVAKTRGALPIMRVEGVWSYTCPICRKSIVGADLQELELSPVDQGALQDLNSDSDDEEEVDVDEDQDALQDLNSDSDEVDVEAEVEMEEGAQNYMGAEGRRVRPRTSAVAPEAPRRPHN